MPCQTAFDRVSESVEWVLSTWWGASAYLGTAALCYLPWGWDGPDRFLTMTGGVILVLLVGGGRRSMKAVHAKLDDIDEREDMTRVEELSEAEIERRRK